MIVVDASAFVEFLEGTAAGAVVRRFLLTEDSAVPHLFDAEVLHRLVTRGKHGLLRPDQVAQSIEKLRTSPMTRFDHRPRLFGAANLSTALSGYDSLYAVLAIELEATLVTTDKAFARTASSQLGIEVADLGLG